MTTSARSTSILRRTATWVAAATVGLGLTAAASPANAAPEPSGERSLATVLTSDGNRFDRNPFDYDIVTEAVLAVLADNPNSPVKALTEGSKPLTAFIPNDLSFRLLTKDLTGRWYWSEEKVFTKLAEAVGIDNIEAVLLYHVVPGLTIDSDAARNADGAKLETALGSTFTVDVKSRRAPLIRLRDNDRNDIDPLVLRRQLDINEGNKQIAHGIFFVLRPLDL